MRRGKSSIVVTVRRCLERLLRESAANTMMIVAGGLLPLLALIGGSIDVGRAYLAETRLQQACDAGVLAARKRLGSQAVLDGGIPAEVERAAQRFFGVNYQDGAFGSENRAFRIALDDQFSVNGSAQVDVPTTIMSIFGQDSVDLSVACTAKLNFSNLDIMMVLDVTGSMRHTNAGDSAPRIEVMKAVIRDFHRQLESSKSPTSRVRYGFVPYASNVSVAHLLKDEWVTTRWTYQSREQMPSTRTYERNWRYVSGTRSSWTPQSSYAATYYPPGTTPEESLDSASATSSGTYRCEQPLPRNTVNLRDRLLGTAQYPFAGPTSGTQIVQTYRRTRTGDSFRHSLNNGVCTVEKQIETDFVEDFDRVTEPHFAWRYAPIEYDVANWRTEGTNCIEERKTTRITDYSSVDLAANLDLDIHTVPTADNPNTQWRPMYPRHVYARAFDQWGYGSWKVAPTVSSSTYAQVGYWWMSGCPAPARKLAQMDQGALDSYLATLSPAGATYHDIGMIWGGRLLSPRGLFAAENADLAGNPTSRHLIFLTDGQTEPYDMAYGSYGLEPLDRRRWQPGSPMTLAQTVEARFGVACNEVKKMNTTVWVIAFGTDLNAAMTQCAGAGRYFEADSAESLNQAFSTIAESMGELRLSR